MMDDFTCAGCGVRIQTEDQNGLGYTPASALNRDPVLCQRCFRLRHYNEVQDIPLNDDDFLKIVSMIRGQKALIVYLVDIFDIAGSWVPDLNRMIGDNPVLLIGNKADLFPKSTNANKLKSWMRGYARQAGIRPVDVLLMSAEKNHGIDEVSQKMNHYRRGRHIYVVGATNVGKSTFINHLIRETTGQGEVITTSRFPGTTLDFIGIPLDDGQTLFDTPGVVNPRQMIHFLDPRDCKKVIPAREIKPRVYQLNAGQTLFLGGLVRVDYLGPGRRSLIVYASNQLGVHRTKTENAEDLFRRQYGQLLAPTVRQGEPPDLVRHDFRTREGDMDVVISGLGWVTIKGSAAEVAASAAKGIGVSLRPSIIRGQAV